MARRRNRNRPRPPVPVPAPPMPMMGMGMPGLPLAGPPDPTDMSASSDQEALDLLLRPDPLPSEEVWSDVVEPLTAHFAQRHERQEEDLCLIEGRWDQPGEKTKKIAQEELASNRFLYAISQKFIAILGNPKRQATMQPARPEHQPLIERGLAHMHWVEYKTVERWRRQTHRDFYWDEARFLCYRGDIALRCHYDKAAARKGDPCVQWDAVDSITLSWWRGADGLIWVVQDENRSKLELVADFPNIEDQSETVANGELKDHFRVTRAYDKNFIYTFVDNQLVGEPDQDGNPQPEYHGYGEVPWIILTPLGTRLDSGQANLGLTYSGSSQSSSLASVVAPEENIRQVGVTPIEGAIGPSRTLSRSMSQIANVIAKLDDPPWMVEGDTGNAFQADTRAHGKISIPNGVTATPLLSNPGELAFLNTFVQFCMDQLRRATLSDASFGLPQQGAESGLMQQAVTKSDFDTLKPLVRALCTSQWLRWYFEVKLQAKYALSGTSDQYPAATFPMGGGSLEWQTLTPDDFQALQDAVVEVEFVDLLPNALAGDAGVAVQLRQSQLVSRETLLGPRFLRMEDPGQEVQRLEAEEAEQLPVIRIAKSLVSIKDQDPELFQLAAPALSKLLQTQDMQMDVNQQQMQVQMLQGQLAELMGKMQLMQAVMSQLGLMPPPGPPGASPPGGVPPSPMGPPGAGMAATPPGGPMPAPNGHSQVPPGMPPQQFAAQAGAAAAPPPRPWNVPGAGNLAAGGGGIAGGVHPGVPTSVLPPGALGQQPSPPNLLPDLAALRNAIEGGPR